MKKSSKNKKAVGVIDAGTAEVTSRIRKVPVISLENLVVFPYTLSPLVIEGNDSIKMVEQASSGDRLVGIFPVVPEMPENDSSLLEYNFEEDEFAGKRISRMGVLARIVKLLKFPDGSIRVLVRGLSRIKYVSSVAKQKQWAIIEPFKEDKEEDNIETVAMTRNAINQFQEIINFSPNFPEELKIAIMNVNDNVRIVDLISDAINISFPEKLSILTLPTLHERLQLLTILLNREVEVLQLGSEIQSQVHNAMSKSQREFFLREQLKTIKNELGEGNRNPDLVSIEERLEKLTLPEAVVQAVRKEMERLEMIPQASPEYNVAYNYVDWLLSVPWENFSDDRLEVCEAAKILDADHYDLKDVKERILEFLAVLQLKNDRKSPILCFVGPPGVGKTSLGQSIARAMGREFIRMSLGGVRDEAEIRGHRRTYIGAMPGRIVQGMKRAGTSNPVFMLDEIDKLGNDFRGDPSSALLEVLDPQQNHAFNDHYIELDYDLSAVMFIATANILDTIPPALLDRMEIIRLPGYTAMEKKQIAKRFLIPKQIRENGLKRRQIYFGMTAIDEIIGFYTREAGVRTLERTIASVLRKIGRRIVEGKIKEDAKTKVTPEMVRELLGPRKFIQDEAEREPEIGVATGLAWTSVGGTILPVEATLMPGKGEVKLTGSLGDVMKESAMTAFSFVRSRSPELKLADDFFQKNDFHIHVPDGATPKDGPSAGVTLAVAMTSMLTRKPARTGVAMTGEITLRGKVTPIGGVKEKVIAALRAGIKTVLLPEANRKDLAEIPPEIRKKLEFKFFDHVDGIIKYMLENPKK